MFAAFIRNDDGQDLSEYCLLTALVALIALGIFIHLSGGVQSIWSSSNSTLTTAAGAITGSTTGNATASSPASH